MTLRTERKMPPRARKKRAAEGAEPEEGAEAKPEKTKAKAKAKPKAKKPKVAPPAPRPEPWPERCDALGAEVEFRAYPSAEVCTRERTTFCCLSSVISTRPLDHCHVSEAF